MLIVNFENIADLKTFHPGPSVPVAATILGFSFPTDEAFSVYSWDFNSTATADDVEVVKPTADPTSNGRWLRVDLSAVPQVNANWTATSGPAFILNKPSLSTVATSGSYADLSGKPTIPPGQVNSDWGASSGLSQILNKPSLATVATSGSYSDLSGKPTVPSSITVGTANARTLSLATAYQATDASKPAVVTVVLTSNASLSLSGGTTIQGEVRVGTSSAVATGSGVAVGAYKNSLTGSLTVGLNVQTESYGTITFVVPANGYFAIRQTSGSGLTVVSAFDQSINI